MKRCLNIGVIGAGGFATFAAEAFIQIENVAIIAVTDINNDAATQLAIKLHATCYHKITDLLNDTSIDLIYIATPPFLHYEHSTLALNAGKHVICEKPAALNTSQAEELKLLADKKNLLYVVNLMQRYNPLYQQVKTIINKKILGSFLHGFFENYASDESLDKDHWFWDETKSGGIFIEHGVHFFDMFSGWLGKGDVISSLCMQRNGVDATITDRVSATVMYHEGFVNFYHGFDQPKILDRQELRLEFERGEITLYEWVPVKIKLHGLVKNEDVKFIENLFGATSVIHTGNTKHKKVKGRFIEIDYDSEIILESGSVSDKQERYEQLLISMLKDQWSWIKDRKHKRIIDGCNAVESLRTAEEAEKKALKFN